MHSLSLAGTVRRWRQMGESLPVKRIDEKTILVLSPELAVDVLLNSNEYFKRTSGFFRTTSHSPVNDLDLASLSTGTKAVLRAHNAPNDDQIRSYVRAHSTSTTQDFGPRFMLWYFEEAIGVARSAALREASEFYFERVILRSTIRGVVPSYRRRDFETARVMAGAALAGIGDESGQTTWRV